MGGADRLERFFRHDLWTLDVRALHGPQRLIVQALRLAYAVAIEFRARLLDARAAGLVYTTLLSLVPLLAVMFSVLKAFGVHHQIEPVLAQLLAPLGPKGQEITANIIRFVDNLRVGVLGIVGIAGLFYTTYSLIDKIEGAFNAIWRVRQARSWTRKFTDYLSVVLVGPVLVLTAFGLLASVQSHTLVQRVLDVQPFGYVAVWAAQYLPFAILCGVFTFLYAFMPNTRVRLLSAFVGALVAALLWGAAGEVFAAFVVGSARYSAIYSGFAILILFLLWLYIGWLIILVGAQVSFFHQHPLAYQTHVLWKQGTHAFTERAALTVLLTITRRYLNAEPPYRSRELASDANLPVSVVEEQVDDLVEQGLLGRLAEPDGIGLVKPPESILLADVLEGLREKRPTERREREPEDPVDRVLRRRDSGAARALGGLTLRAWALERGAEEAQDQPHAILHEPLHR
ncbi:YhjD/YihY/BrkB family envelope integrity protein [Candidatus Nitrospira bockiana]